LRIQGRFEEMSNIYEYAFEELMKLEGEYVNDKDDPGGETNWGISKRSYPDLDINNLTKLQAKEIYQRDYWDSIWLDQVVDDFIAAEMFEQAVNMGPATAVENAQRACNYLGEKLKVDGVMGPNTLHAINLQSGKGVAALLKVLNALQFQKYLAIVKNNPKMAKYSRGWLSRVKI